MLYISLTHYSQLTIDDPIPEEFIVTEIPPDSVACYPYDALYTVQHYPTRDIYIILKDRQCHNH